MPFTVIASALVGSLGAFAVQLTATALSVGANYLLAKKQKDRKKTTFTAFQGETSYGTDVHLQVAFGVVLTKGHEVRYFKWGAGNKFNASVVQLSDFRCDGLEPYVFMNGEKYPLIAKDIIGNEHEHWGIDGFEDLTSIRFYDGRQNQLADAKLISDTSNLGSTWKSTSAGEGICYVIFEREYSSVWEFEPDPSYALRGLRCYDPRKDDTITGGAGLHRITDPDTWEFTKNPSLQRLMYLYGLRSPVTGNTLVGMDKSVSEIDINSHIAAANVADTQRVISSRTVSTYECNMLVSSDDDFSEVLESMDDAMAGYSANRGGIAAVIAGAPQASTFTIEDKHIRRDANIKYRPRRNIDELVNSLSGQYTNIEAQFTPDSLQTISVNADITEDNGLRQLQKDYLQINDPDIAQYVLQIQYRQNRKGKSVILPIVNSVYFGINAGDWGTYNNQLWMCLEKSDGQVVLVEVGTDTYASQGIVAGPITTIPATPQNPSLLSALQGFGVSAGEQESTNGSSRPVLRVTWTPPSDPTIIGILVTYYPQGTNEVYTQLIGDVEAGEFTIDQNVVSGKVYNLKALIQTNPDRFRQATPLIATSIPTVDSAIVLAELQQDTRSAIERISNRLTEISRSIQETNYSAQIISSNEAIQRREVAVRASNALAAVLQEAQARISGDEASAQALIAAIANVDTEIAEGYLSFEASVDPQGAFVEIAIVARALNGENDDYSQAGTVYRVTPDGVGGYDTVIINQADQWSLVDSNGDLVIGTNNGDIISNAKIISPDGKFEIDPIAGSVRGYD